ncbi:MAG: ATP-binding protein [Salinivirgaceae bacterium]|nr:ATP-binding protein [Salinivirgaceae bacterium]
MNTKKYIKRNSYINQVQPFIGKNLIKVFTGQRRVGKSYLCYQLIDYIKSNDAQANIIYINKELYEFDSIRDYNDLYMYFNDKHAPDKTNYFIIDEIQDIVGFEKCLRSILAEERADLYITGSNSEILAGDLATYLSGRYIEIKVYSLSFSEFLVFHKLEPNHDSFIKYLQYGGLPGLVNLGLNENLVYDYLRNIYATILLKDVVKRHNVRNIYFLESLVKYVAEITGSIVSAKKASDFLKSQQIKISPNVVMAYLDYLTSSFFIFKVDRSDIEGKKIFEIGQKYYFEDLGLRNSLIGYRQNDINKLLENIVYLHLKIAGYEVKIGWEHGREIDFIATRTNQKIYVQVAYLIPDKQVHDREFGNLLKINDQYPKYVLSMDTLMDTQYKGIKHQSVMQFILDIVLKH